MTTTKLLSLTLLLAATMGICGVSSAEEVKDSTSTQIVSVEDSDLRNEEALRVAVGDFDDVEFLLSADEMATIADNVYVSFNGISAQGGEGSGSSMFSAEASERVETTQGASSSFNGALTLASATNTSETVTVRQSAVATTSLSFDNSTEQYAVELQSLDKGRDGVGTLISSDDSSVSKETVSFLGNFDSVSDTDGSYGISTLSNGGDIKPLSNYDCTWNGTDSDNIWDNNVNTNKNWLLSGKSDYWINSGKDTCNAIFGGTGYSTVIVDAGIEAANLTVTGNSEYTFEYSNGASLSATGTVTIGNSSGSGSLTINGGTNTFTGAIYVGYNNEGLLTITDGTNTFGSADSEIDIGWAPSGSTTGTLKITGGDNTFSAGNIRLGYSSGDTGKIEITGGTVEFALSSAQSGVPTIIYVGMGGTGEIIIGTKGETEGGPDVTFQAGSTANTTLYLGYNSGSKGTITINSGTTKFDSSVDLYVGGGDYTTGAIEINGGTTIFDTAVYLGHATSSKGTLTITGGDNKFNEAVYIGYTDSSTGSLTISGGTNTFGTVYVGRTDGSTRATGTMTVTNGYTTVDTLSVNNGQTTTVSGGTLVVTNLEQNNSSTLNVTEGTVVLGTLSQADSSGLNISGGSVEITTGTSGASGAYIKASGSGKLILDVAVTAGESGSTGSGLTIEFKDNSTLVIQGGLLDSIVAAAGDYVAVLQAETIYFREYLIQYTGEVPELNDDLINGCVYAGGYDLTWKYDSSTHILSAAIAAPEPSMFGLMLGLGAIGLVATRRRQRVA